MLLKGNEGAEGGAAIDEEDSTHDLKEEPDGQKNHPVSAAEAPTPIFRWGRFKA